MTEPGRPWLIVNFEPWLIRWVREYQPPLAVIVAVRAWVKSREENPFAGVNYEPGFDNYLFGAIPNTMDGDGRVVTCAYWVHRDDHVVRCDMISTASWPV